ncbi:MAG: type I glyceraldehyde-3-phosphate dehydrogenase [Patescibacteria group bacterium]|jgi:glyceraldehyde 3-phosphate dehydrogenase
MAKKQLKVAINGFGRIGRASFKIILDKYPQLKVVAINDLTDTQTLAQLLQFDSCYGKYHREIKSTKDSLRIGKQKFSVFSEKDPSQLPWQKLKVDVVLECTGIFRTQEAASAHLGAGAKKVIVSAPGKGCKTIVMGVNENKLNKSDHVFSCASCTTNCLAPTTKVIREKFGIKKAVMSTVHAYTADQNIVDGPHKDLRRARAAAVNIVPTTTGAATAVAETIPSLKDKFNGLALRVPIPVGSLCDITYVLAKKTTPEAVKAEFVKASQGKLKGILEASNDYLVSSDIVGNPHSAIVDLQSTAVVAGDLLKVIAWYDNEWGYSNRLVDLADYVKKFI